ncbi:MAG TPA: hypothetical protein VJW20_03305 [Candidatus Angelobacter sp.]|nr:hypothetical protein [Candidatus Angelobacter sp.]
MDDKNLPEREIEPREATDPKATVNILGLWYAPEEVEQVERQNAAREAAYEKEMKEKWLETTEGKLCMSFYEAFQQYRKYLEENPPARRRADGAEVDFEEHQLFEEGLRLLDDHRQEREEKLRRNLEKAQKAARCQHQYLNGKGCGAPRMKGQKLCRMHERMEEAKAVKLDLGPMEDPDSIQVGIKRLQRAIIDGKLDAKQIGHLAYTIQLAAWNVTRTTTANQNLTTDRRG